MKLISEKSAVLFTAICLFFAWINFPLHFYNFFSVDGILNEKSLLDVKILRLFFLASGLFTLLSTVFWRLNKNAGWRKVVEADFSRFRLQKKAKSHEEGISLIICGAILTIITAALVLTIYLSFHYYDPAISWSDTDLFTKDTGWFDKVVMENGFWETLQAVNLLLAGVFLVYTALRYRSSLPLPMSFLPPLLLGMLFVVAAGEEVSWGQHYLGFGTPEVIKEHNLQEEFNFHNIGSYWANMVMILFFFSYVVCLPVLALLFQDIRYLVDRLAIPLSPATFIPFGCIGVLFDEHDAISRLWGTPPWRLSEAREALFTCIILCVAVLFLLNNRSLTSQRLRQGN
jgi:hypothetical protein